MDDRRALVLVTHAQSAPASCVVAAERWLRDHPDDVLIQHYYAEMLTELSRYDAALRTYTTCLDLWPPGRRYFAHVGMGHLNRRRGDLTQAEDCYQQAIEVCPEDAGHHIFLGAVQARQGKLQEAEQTHRNATECTKGCVDEAYHNLGLVVRGQWRLDEARECFERAIQLDAEYEDAIAA